MKIKQQHKEHWNNNNKNNLFKAKILKFCFVVFKLEVSALTSCEPVVKLLIYVKCVKKKIAKETYIVQN